VANAADRRAHEDFAANGIADEDSFAYVSSSGHSDERSHRINNNRCSDHHALQSK
jgi:hypothetical protein